MRIQEGSRNRGRTSTRQWALAVFVGARLFGPRRMPSRTAAPRRAGCESRASGTGVTSVSVDELGHGTTSAQVGTAPPDVGARRCEFRWWRRSAFHFVSAPPHSSGALRSGRHSRILALAAIPQELMSTANTLITTDGALLNKERGRRCGWWPRAQTLAVDVHRTSDRGCARQLVSQRGGRPCSRRRLVWLRRFGNNKRHVAVNAFISMPAELGSIDSNVRAGGWCDLGVGNRIPGMCHGPPHLLWAGRRSRHRRKGRALAASRFASTPIPIPRRAPALFLSMTAVSSLHNRQRHVVST